MSRNNKIEGIGSILAGEYDVVSIEGMGKVKGDVICNELKIEGMYKGRGKVKTALFTCEGMARIYKDIQAKEVSIEGMVKLKGAKLEAEHIKCEGMLTCTEEVLADEIEILGLCSIAKLYGDKIKISMDVAKRNVNIPKGIGLFASGYIGRRVSSEYCIVDFIECSELEADYLESKVIKAHNIKLGAYCKVDVIECDGVLEYDETCKIGKIIADQVNKKLNLDKKGEKEMADIKLTKILELYKESKISADEAEKMLMSLGKVTGSVKVSTPKFDDDKLRVVVMKGNKVISQKDYQKGMTIQVEYLGDVGAVECWGDLTCGNVEGNVHAKGSIKAETIKGSADAGGSINAVTIGGNADTGGSIKAEVIKGSINSRGSVQCNEVGGSINTRGGVRISK